MTAFLPTYIKMETGNLWLAGIALTLFEAAGVAGVLAAGSISDWFGRRKTLLVSLLGAPPFPVCFYLKRRVAARGRPDFYRFYAFINHPRHAGPGPGKCPAHACGGNGLFMMISFIARSAVVVVVGFIADRIGLNTTYLISAAVGLIGIPFVLMLPRK